MRSLIITIGIVIRKLFLGLRIPFMRVGLDGWAQGWAEYGKVYSALVIMAIFFSSIMTLLFRIRDRVLVWQKGMIKW